MASATGPAAGAGTGSPQPTSPLTPALKPGGHRRRESGDKTDGGIIHQLAIEGLAKTPNTLSPRPLSPSKMADEIARLNAQVQQLQATILLQNARAKQADEELRTARDYFAVPQKQRAIRVETDQFRDKVFKTICDLTRQIEEEKTPIGRDEHFQVTTYNRDLLSLQERGKKATEQLINQKEVVERLSVENGATELSLKKAERCLDWSRKLIYVYQALNSLSSKVKALGKAIQPYSAQTYTNLTEPALQGLKDDYREVERIWEELAVEKEKSDLHHIVDLLLRMNPLKRDKEEELLGKLPMGEECSFYLSCKSLRERFCKQWDDVSTQHLIIKLQLHLMEDLLKITHPLDGLTAMHNALYASLQKAETRFRTNNAPPNNGYDPATKVSCKEELKSFYYQAAEKFETLINRWLVLEPLFGPKFEKYTKLKETFANFKYTEDAAEKFCLDKTRTIDSIKVDLCMFHDQLIKKIEIQEKQLQTSLADFKKLPLPTSMHYLDWLEPVATGKELNLVWWSYYKSFRAWRGPNALKFLAGQDPPKLEIVSDAVRPIDMEPIPEEKTS